MCVGSACKRNPLVGGAGVCVQVARVKRKPADSMTTTTAPHPSRRQELTHTHRFGPSLGAGAKTRLESRIKEFTPHCVCSPHAHAQSRSQSHITYHKKYISNPYVGYITITHMYITMRCSQHLDSREYFLQFFFCYFCYFFAIGSQHQ